MTQLGTVPNAVLGLRRSLGLVDTTAILTSCVVGVGIFIVPGEVAAAVDSPVIVLALWVLGGIISLAGALSIGELAAAFPEPGGMYTYLRRVYGDQIGFLYGWGAIVVVNCAVSATLAIGTAAYISKFASIGESSEKVVSVGVIALIAGINVLGIEQGKWVQNWLTVIKLVGLAFLIIVFLLLGSERASSFRALATTGREWDLLHGASAALVAIMWTFDGWAYAGFSAGEMKAPQQDLPRALLLGMLFATAVYVLLNVAYYSALSPSEIRQTERVATTAMNKVAGEATEIAVSLLIVIILLGSLNAIFLTGTRCPIAMATDGLLPMCFARLHPRSLVPVIPILVQGCFSAALVWVGKVQELLGMTVATSWLFYAIAAAGVIVLRRTAPTVKRPYRVPLFPYLPGVYCLVALGISTSAVVASPIYSLLGAALLASGVPVYLYMKSRS